MLSSQLTLDDEDAVQTELKELQDEVVSETRLILEPIHLTFLVTAPRDRTERRHRFTFSPNCRTNRSGHPPQVPFFQCCYYAYPVLQKRGNRRERETMFQCQHRTLAFSANARTIFDL
jgi:hypothetical protein